MGTSAKLEPNPILATPIPPLPVTPGGLRFTRVASLVTSLEIQRVNPPPMPPSGERDSDATLSVVESRFRGAIAASLDAFFLCESVRDDAGEIVDFRVLELNERAEAFLGRSRIELVGQLVCDIVPAIRESGLLDQLIQV